MIRQPVAIHQNICIHLELGLSPSVWVRAILREPKGGDLGKVQRHLVGATLQIRFPERRVLNYPGHAGDVQTGRWGDFDVDWVSYHVTANPGKELIEKCRLNVAANRHPILVVPAEQVPRARTLAEVEGIGDRVTILALEEFVAHNVIEISVQNGSDFYATLQKIVAEYNKRVEEVETDMALKIELL